MRILTVISAAMALGVASLPAALAEEEVQTGGALNVISFLAAFDIMNFDNTSWSWKNNADQMGTESLARGNLQKGPRGTNEYNFKPSDFMPYSVIEGSLAESWTISRDPLQIEFKLRDGVTWMPIEGVMGARPLDANDVVKSFEAMNDSPTAVPDFWSYVDRWEAKDDRTVVIHLNSFYGSWDYALTWGYYDGIMPVERIALTPEERSDWRKLGGTGPYRLAELRQGERQVYEKNPNYWDREVIGGTEYQLPMTDKVVLNTIRDPSAAIAALTSGEIDIVEAIRWQFIDQIKSASPDIVLQEYMTYSGTYIALRVDQKPFDDVRVRRALNIAVDQEAIRDAVMNGRGELLNFPFNSSWTGYYTPIEELSAEGQELFKYDPERAKALLKEAGLENGFEFDVIVNSNNQAHMDMLPMVQAYYEMIGVKMNIKPMEAGAYQAQRKEPNRTAAYMIDNGSGTPVAVLRKSFLTGQAWNPAYFSDPEFDAAYVAAAEEIDDDKRVAMLKELNRRIIEDDVPHVWLPTPAVYTAWWPWVKNYHGELAIGAQRQNSIYARVWIDEALKREMGYAR